MLQCTLLPATEQQPATLQVSGEAGIQYVQQFKDALIAALRDHPNLVVDCRGVDTADFSCLQLLCSAHRTCPTLCLSPESHVALAVVIEAAGLERFQGCVRAVDKRSCIWICDN